VSPARSPAPLQQPATLWVPPRRGSYGPEIIEWAGGIGIEMDLEQQRDIDVLASYGPGGDWLVPEAGIIEGRQNGKTKSVLLPIALADLFLFSDTPDRIFWTSHLMKTSLDTFGRVMELIENNRSLKRRVKSVTESKSEQAILLDNGASFELLARTGGGGRGLGGKRVVFDEALFLLLAAMGALLPTLRSRGNPQINYGSSAGKPESDHLRSLQARGRRGGDPGLILIEYRADGSWADPGCLAGKFCTHIYGVEGCSLDDENRWRQANHAIGRGRMRLQSLRSERSILCRTPEGVLEYGREALGWEEAGGALTKPIPIKAWADLAVPDSYPKPAGRPVFFVTIEKSSASATIATAADGLGGIPHVELADHRLGTDWLLAKHRLDGQWQDGRLQQLKAAYPDAVFAAWAKGPVESLGPELQSAKFELELLAPAEQAQACGHVEKLMAGRADPDRPDRRLPAFTHSGDPIVVDSMAGYATRTLDQGVWTLDWKTSTGNLAPFAAEIGALWLLEKHRGETKSEPGSAPVTHPSASSGDLWRPTERLNL